MSASSTTATGSRSPSPLTPEASDSLEPIAIQSDLDLSSPWYRSMHSHPTKMPVLPWPSDPSVYTTPHKSEEEQMLRLEELIERHAYDEYVSTLFHCPQTCLTVPLVHHLLDSTQLLIIPPLTYTPLPTQAHCRHMLNPLSLTSGSVICSFRLATVPYLSQSQSPLPHPYLANRILHP
jgi:hypothetical protein